MKDIVMNERGSEKFYSIMGFGVLLLVMFLAYSFGVPYFRNMSLETYAQKMVDYDFHNQKPSQEGAKNIYDRVIRHARSKKLRVDPTKVAVDYDAHKYEVRIQYEQNVNLLVTEYTWSFNMHKKTRTRQ